MTKLKLAVILGTTRVGNKSQHVAKHILRVAEASGDWEPIFVDPAELSLPGDGNDEAAKDPKYTKITEEADAFFIVAPEYNHAYPGSLKRLLDSESSNYIHKPASVAGVSAGGFGGVRAMVSLAPVLRELGMVYGFGDVMVSDSYNAYNDETGEAKIDSIQPQIEASLVELKWLAQTLKYGRENLESKYHAK